MWFLSDWHSIVMSAKADPGQQIADRTKGSAAGRGRQSSLREHADSNAWAALRVNRLAGEASAAVPRRIGTIMAQIIKPGEDAPKSAQYELVGPHGGRKGVEVTVPKGKTMPPTPEKGQGYIVADPTKNKSGR